MCVYNLFFFHYKPMKRSNIHIILYQSFVFAYYFLLPQQNHEKITLASAADQHQPWKKDSRMEEELYQRSIIIRLIRGMIIKMIGWHVSCWQKIPLSFFTFLQEKILLFVISWQEKKLLTCKNTTVCYLLTRETRKRRRSPWPRPTLSPMIGTNLLCKTGDWKPVITVCVYIHMFSSHTFCIWRNRLFHLGLVPKSSGIKYMVDANNGHPNI